MNNSHDEWQEYNPIIQFCTRNMQGSGRQKKLEKKKTQEELKEGRLQKEKGKNCSKYWRLLASWNGYYFHIIFLDFHAIFFTHSLNNCFEAYGNCCILLVPEIFVILSVTLFIALILLFSLSFYFYSNSLQLNFFFVLRRLCPFLRLTPLYCVKPHYLILF